MTGILDIISFQLVLFSGMVVLELCISQDEWGYTFVLEIYNSVSGSRLF